MQRTVWLRNNCFTITAIFYITYMFDYHVFHVCVCVCFLHAFSRLYACCVWLRARIQPAKRRIDRYLMTHFIRRADNSAYCACNIYSYDLWMAISFSRLWFFSQFSSTFVYNWFLSLIQHGIQLITLPLSLDSRVNRLKKICTQICWTRFSLLSVVC